ncbi:hypothetical protein F0562_029217 [Nyssa sinensis]|uniref:Uncharacterized protein n=1 Tax=Nyssa sinensis TaxID=561372 RepID=A0A5J5B204_9ASTE|nr:hypothetical protein F0562_029217 [Nyssa sinensis]
MAEERARTCGPSPLLSSSPIRPFFSSSFFIEKVRSGLFNFHSSRISEFKYSKFFLFLGSLMIELEAFEIRRDCLS